MKIKLTVKELHELLSETIEDITTNKLTAFIERHNTPNQTAQPTSRLATSENSKEIFSSSHRKPINLNEVFDEPALSPLKRKQTAAAKALISKKLKAAWRKRKAQARLKRFIRRINKKTKPPLPKSKVR